MSGFDDLELQLRRKVAAGAKRQRRPLLRTFLAAAVVLASAGGVTAAATGVIGGPGAAQRASDLLDEVTRATEDVPVCRQRGPDRRPAYLSALPASDLALHAFPALRRPATARERAFARRQGRMAGQTRVLSGGARELRAADGARFMLMITAGRGRGIGRDPDCIPVLRAELERRAPGTDAEVLAIARESLDREQRAYRDNLGREGLLLASLGRDGRLAGAGGTYTDVAVRRGTGGIGIGRVGGKRRLVVDGLVPAQADHVIVRSRSQPGAKPVRAEVPEQVFRVALPRGFGPKVSVEWRASDGRLLNVLRMRW